MAYTRINWQDLPSTATPRNATNLNKMDSAIKEHDDKLLGNTSMGNVVVDSIRSKNMFDKNSYFGANGGVGSYLPLDTGVRAITGGTGTNQWLNFKLPNSLLGKQCTLSFNATPSSTNTPMVRIYYGSSSNMANVNANFDLYGSGSKSITNTFLSSFPSGTDAIYMLVYCNRDGSGFNSGAYIDYTNFQLEEGETATSYSPYQDLNPQIQQITNYTRNTTYVSSTGYLLIYKYGKICVISLNVQLVDNTPSNTTLLSGLPKGAIERITFSGALNNGNSLRLYITNDGEIKNDGVIYLGGASGWINSFVVYFCE